MFGESLVPVAVPELADRIASPQDLLRHRLIEISSNRAGWLNVFDLIETVDLSLARFWFVDDTITAFAFAAQGDAIALARPPVTGFLERQFGLVPCLPEAVGHCTDLYRLVAHPGRPMTEPSKRFRDWLLERTKQERA